MLKGSTCRVTRFEGASHEALRSREVANSSQRLPRGTVPLARINSETEDPL